MGATSRYLRGLWRMLGSARLAAILLAALLLAALLASLFPQMPTDLASQEAWLAAATSRYLRMPHALGVGLAVTVVGALASLAVMGWIWLTAHAVY